MKTKDVRNVLKALAMDACGECEVALPNVNVDASIFDRTEITVVGVVQSGETLKGNEIFRETGVLMVIATSPFGEGEDAAMDRAEEVASVFKHGRYFKVVVTPDDMPVDLAELTMAPAATPLANPDADATGWITIRETPTIRSGYRDASVYRVPVAVKYVATAFADANGQVRG